MSGFTHAALLFRTRPKNPTAAAARWAIGPLLPLATVAVMADLILSGGLGRGLVPLRPRPALDAGSHLQLSLIGWWAVLVFPWKRGFRVRRRRRLLPTLSLVRPLLYAAVFGFLGLLLKLVLTMLFWGLLLLQRLNT